MNRKIAANEPDVESFHQLVDLDSALIGRARPVLLARVLMAHADFLYGTDQ